MKGKLHIITGPMWSGKTTELLRRHERSNLKGIKSYLIKPRMDTRYSLATISTHPDIEGHQHNRDALSFSTIQEIMNWLRDLPKPIFIYIDEIQFFPDKEKIINLLHLNITVTVAGLNGTFQQELFPDMSRLFASASSINMLTSVCYLCKKDAAYTKKITDDMNVIDIGGSNKYLPSCLSCLDKHFTMTK